jgi:Zn-dependent protease
MTENLQEITCWIISFIVAAALHEYAHAFVANRLGDDTPKNEGRLTLNPFKHMELIGLIVLIISSLNGFGFGWAKPVKITRANLKNPRRDMMLIALAGPVTNIILTAITVIVARIFYGKLNATNPVQNAFQIFMLMNLSLASLNLIPIGMLDGAKVLAGLLPAKAGELFEKTYGWGVIILISLLFTGLLMYLIVPGIILFARITGAFYVLDKSVLNF